MSGDVFFFIAFIFMTGLILGFVFGFLIGIGAFAPRKD